VRKTNRSLFKEQILLWAA